MNTRSSVFKSALYQKSSSLRDTSDDPYSLSYFEAALFGGVLEDIIKEYRIFMLCSNEWRVAQAETNLTHLRALKYKVEQPVVTDDLANIDHSKLDCMEYKLKKMFADRYFIHGALEDTYKSLCVNMNYEPLANYVLKMKDEKARRMCLIEEEANNKLLKRELIRQCRQQRIHTKAATYDADCAIAALSTKVEDAVLNAEIRTRYVENWQRARTEQNHQQIKDKEKMKEDVIEIYKLRFDQEQRIHAEIEMLTTIDTNDTLNKVESWMDKYDTDMEAIDLKIQIMKNNYVVQTEQREEFERTIEEHDVAMKNWIKFKEDRENARLYREKMTKAAIVVQAWWRGLLVRNQLGPYKPPPKKRGGGKKK